MKEPRWMSGPDEEDPPAYEDCVVCGTPLPLDPVTQAITGYQGDGCTCSEPCSSRARALQAQLEADDNAQAEEWLRANPRN